MKCVANKDCQTRTDIGKIRFFSAGEVFNFLKCPCNFSPLEGDGAAIIDFTTAGEELLMESKWKFSDANECMLSNFNRQLKKDENTTKQQVVDQIIDIRYRSLGVDPNKVV